MSDVIERMRARAARTSDVTTGARTTEGLLLEEGADTIESLQRENEELKADKERRVRIAQTRQDALNAARKEIGESEMLSQGVVPERLINGTQAAAITPEMRERMVNEAASLALGYATAHWMTQASLGLDITKSEISELHESWERSGAVRDLLGEQG